MKCAKCAPLAGTPMSKQFWPRDYQDRTGIKVGYKPAGGISKAKDALVYLSMIKDELGDRWLQPDLFRFGASSLLGDIERQLEHHVTGAYSAQWRHAIG